MGAGVALGFATADAGTRAEDSSVRISELKSAEVRSRVYLQSRDV